MEDLQTMEDIHTLHARVVYLEQQVHELQRNLEALHQALFTQGAAPYVASTLSSSPDAAPSNAENAATRDRTV